MRRTWTAGPSYVYDQRASFDSKAEVMENRKYWSIDTTEIFQIYIDQMARSKKKRLNSEERKKEYKGRWLFSRFDEGIRLNKEQWYSATPEPVAK